MFGHLVRWNQEQARGAAIDNGDAASAQEALPLAVKLLQRAASKGVLHGKTASRRVGRLVRAVNQISAGADPKAS